MCVEPELMALADVGDAPSCAMVLGSGKASSSASCCSIVLSPSLSLPDRCQEPWEGPLLVPCCSLLSGLFGLSLPCEW